MTRALNRSAGFTIIELSLVLIVIGILAVVLVPMAQVVHGDAMRKSDQASMDVIKNALMGFIRINAAVPCVDAAGDDVSTGCDSTITLTRLGVRTDDARRQTFAYDVHERLTEKWLDDNSSDICTQLGYLIDPTTIPELAAPPPVEPQVCDAANANTGNTACVPTVPAARPYDSTMALVLVGRGSDRCLNLENAHASAGNDAVCHPAVADNRIFENPARAHELSDGAGYYEDLVSTLSPAELAEVLGCSAGGGGGGGFTYCPEGEVLMQLSNGDGSWMSIDVGASCYAVSAGTTASMGCQPAGTTIEVHSNQSCGQLRFSDSLANLDTNNDGRADMVCDNAPTPNCTWR